MNGPLSLADCCAPCGQKFQAGALGPITLDDLRLARELNVCAPCFVPFAARSRAEAARYLDERS